MSAQKPDLPTADSDGGRDEAMYRGLHAAIYELRLPPGTRLPEDVLSNTYGVSRTLVRKVLQRMAMEGLVEIRRNRGAQVAEPSADEAREVFATRRMLECGALAELPLPVPAAELQALRELVRQEDDAQLNSDRVAAIRLSGDVHIRLAALGGNATLTKLVRELVARSSLILATHGSPISVTCRHSEHEQIIDLLARGERQAGVAWMAEHFEHITRGLRWREQPLDLFSVLKGGDTPT